MKRIYAFMSVLLVAAMLGALGLNSAQMAQAQIADQCFDPTLRLGQTAGCICLPLSFLMSIPLMFLPIGFDLAPIIGIFEPFAKMLGAIPLISDLLTLAIVFAFGALDTQRTVALSDNVEEYIVSTEMSLVRMIP